MIKLKNQKGTTVIELKKKIGSKATGDKMIYKYDINQ